MPLYKIQFTQTFLMSTKYTNMTKEHLTLEKHLKKTTIVTHSISLLIALLTAFSVVYGFYYNTKYVLDDHTETIDEIKVDVSNINTKIKDSEVYDGTSEVEINAMKSQITDMKYVIDKIDSKLDKILFQTK